MQLGINLSSDYVLSQTAPTSEAMMGRLTSQPSNTRYNPSRTTIDQALHSNSTLDNTAYENQRAQEEFLKHLESLVHESTFDPYNTADFFIETMFIQRTINKNYISIFNTMEYASQILQKAMLVFLAQISYSSLLDEEEQYVISMLKTNNTTLQYRALQTLISWGNISDVTALNGVSIKNEYAQEDLTEFIQKHS